MKIRFLCLLAAAALMLSLPALAEASLTAEQITQMEQRLTELGYHGTVWDGTLDDVTRAAIRSFQTANGMDPTGEADEATIRIMRSDSAVSCNEYLQSLNEYHDGLPVMENGSSGDMVTMIQRTLKTLGYYTGETDGKFGSGTRSAVMRFQMANGLNETGVADRSTLMRMRIGEPLSWDDFLAECVSDSGSTGAYVRLLQDTLSRLGYYNGSLSGIYGDATHRAVAAFQASQQLEATGTADTATCDALLRARFTGISTLRAGSYGDSVTVLQGKLATYGYFDHNITGYYTPSTETAVRLFCMANDLAVSGEAGDKVLSMMEDGSARTLSEARSDLLGDARRQTDAILPRTAALAKDMCGRPFASGDEDLYSGFTFVQYVCVSAGIPVVGADDLLELVADTVNDPGELNAGEIIAYRTEEDGSLKLAIASGGGCAIYAGQESDYVLESSIRRLGAVEVYRWTLPSAAA